MQDINTDKKTYILCAAIHYEDGIKYPHQPRNIEFGIVACGWRHHNCFSTLYSLLGDKYDIALARVQGFITNDGMFVDRKEAAKIAYNSGQIKYKTEKIFSEDLY